MSKWFDQYCKLNRLDCNMILDQIRAPAQHSGYWYNIYTSVVYEWHLDQEEIENIIDRFNSGRDQRHIRRLIEKLERLRSQS